MDREYIFTLTEEEYLGFLRYRMANAKSNRGKRLWLTTGVPAIVICTLIFFKLYRELLWNCLGVAVILLWVMLFSRDIWNAFIKRRINQATLENMNIKGFQEVRYSFGGDSLCCSDTKPRTIYYRDITAFLPIPDMFVFCCANGENMLLPYRSFTGDEDMKGFLKEFEQCWEAARKG